MCCGVREICGMEIYRSLSRTRKIEPEPEPYPLDPQASYLVYASGKIVEVQ